MNKVMYLGMAMILTAMATGCGESVRSGNAAERSPQACGHPGWVLRHVVLFAFKPEATAEQVRSVETAFCALPSKIAAIHDFEWGTDVSIENKAQGFTHCFVVTFRSEAGRAEYLPHPAHGEFVAVLGPHIDKVMVVDYWTREGK